MRKFPQFRRDRLFFNVASCISLLLCLTSALLWAQSYRLKPRRLVMTSRSLRAGDITVSLSLPLTTGGGPSRYPAEVRFPYRGSRLSVYALDGRFRVDNWSDLEAWTRAFDQAISRWQESINADPLLRDKSQGYDDPNTGARFWRAIAALQGPDVPTAKPVGPPATPIEHSISCAIPTAFFGILPALWLIRWGRRRARISSGRCVSCGYDLRASPERCPECGTPVPRRRVLQQLPERAGSEVFRQSR